MHQITVGLLALVVFAGFVGTTVHWAVGVALIVIPVLSVYIRTKLSPAYRESSDQLVEAGKADNS